MRRTRSLLVAAAVLVGTSAAPALAHETRKVGKLEVVVGWAEEPAIAGFQNAVQVFLSGPGADAAELEVTVIFGEAEETTEPLPLEPTFDDPTEYRATVIPTRPGTYTFEIFGDVGDQSFDESFTSSEQTFDDVRNPADLEFPVKDPTRGELAEAIERLSARGEEEDDGPAALGTWLAVAALALSLVALVAARRRPPPPRG